MGLIVGGVLGLWIIVTSITFLIDGVLIYTEHDLSEIFKKIFVAEVTILVLAIVTICIILCVLSIQQGIVQIGVR